MIHVFWYIDVLHVRNCQDTWTARIWATHCLPWSFWWRQVGECADTLWYKQIEPKTYWDSGAVCSGLTTCKHTCEMTNGQTVLLFCDVHIRIGMTLNLQCLQTLNLQCQLVVWCWAVQCKDITSTITWLCWWHFGMYVCMYVCMFVCMYLCMYICMYGGHYILHSNWKLQKPSVSIQISAHACIVTSFKATFTVSSSLAWILVARILLRRKG